MKQVLIQQGRAIVAEVPAPSPEPGTVLVRVHASCISIGTEMSGVRASATPLWKRALRQPEQVKRVLGNVATNGIRRTWSLVEQKRTQTTPTGYSAAGTVIAVGDGVTDLAVGDRVACAGAQSAYHAEVIRVPRNLTVPLPDEIGWEAGATVTLGAIALQGVRRAQPTLGETFVVVGLGILGQLTAQLLRANGCRVIGVDLDRGRIGLARELGMNVGVHPEDAVTPDQVARLTDGYGADGVIITAASSSDAVIATAFQMCRKKGRVILVGDVGLNLNREDFYVKEIDFLISTSYGPGRYDHMYEERGLEYPLAYVRWTENRNMAEYLRLIADGRVLIEPLATGRYPVTEASAAYAALGAGDNRHLLVLLTYPNAEAEPATPVRKVATGRAANVSNGTIRVALVGAGSFAKGMHLPNLQSLGSLFSLRAVVSRSGHNAMAIAEQFGASYASTEFDEVLADPEVDAVIIATRHHLHAQMALAALRAGKHVLLEKPLALTADELREIESYMEGRSEGDGGPVLLTGFNRRFSPYGEAMRKIVSGRSAPFICNYRMNAGYLPSSHWVHGPEGGGRNLGEACHIYDLFTFLADAPVTHVSATSVAPTSSHYRRDDNFVATMAFADGSVSTLTYTSLGTSEYPKELAELYVDGKVAALHDYTSLRVTGAKVPETRTSTTEKGQQQELRAFASVIREGGRWPIPFWQQAQATRIALEVEQHLTSDPSRGLKAQREQE